MIEIVHYRDGQISGKCLQGYENLQLVVIPWDTIKYKPQPGYELIKASHTRRVVKFLYEKNNSQCEWVFAKRTRIRSLRKSVAHIFLPSKATREWEIGLRLRKLSINTAQPLISAEKRQGIFLKESFLVTRAIDKARAFSAIFPSLRATQKWQALEELSSYLVFLHKAGFYHDDCSTRHILVTSSNLSLMKDNFFIIDLDHCRILKRVSKLKALKNVFQIVKSLPAQRLFKTDKLRLIKANWGKDIDKRTLRRYIFYLNFLARLKGEKKYL